MGDTSAGLLEHLDTETQLKISKLFTNETEEAPKEENPSPPVSKTEIKKALKLKKKTEQEDKKKSYFTSADKLSRLEKYEELDRNHRLNRKFQGSANFKGPSGRQPITIRFL